MATRPPAGGTTDRDEPEGLPQWLAMAGMATVGMTAVRVADWTVSDFLFLASSLLVVLRLLTGSRRNLAPPVARRTSPTLLIGLAFLTVGGLLATVFRSFDPGASALALVRVGYITVIWFWTLRSVSSSVRTFRRLLLAAIVGAVFHSLVGVYQDVSGANAVSPHWGRSPGFADHYGDLGISVGSFIPLLAVWRREDGRRGRRDLLRVGALLVLLAGVGSSGSMTPLGAAIVGTFVAVVAPRMVRGRRRGRRRIVLPLLAAGITIGLVVTGTVDLPVQTRFNELTSNDPETTASAESRADMTQIAVDGIVASPVLGVGLDRLSGGTIVDGDNLQIHSFYFRIAYEAGVLGFTGLLIILFIFARQSIQLLGFTANSSLNWLPAGLLGSYVMVLVSAMFGPVLYGRISWLPMAVISALFGLGRAGLMNDYVNAPAQPPYGPAR